VNEYPTDTVDDDDDGPGWSAIDASLASLYGDQTPQHMGTLLRYRLGGPDPLEGISVYYREPDLRQHRLLVLERKKILGRKSEWRPLFSRPKNKFPQKRRGQ